jgi:hypothetical protein
LKEDFLDNYLLNFLHNTKRPLLNPLSLKTQEKPRKVYSHSVPWWTTFVIYIIKSYSLKKSSLKLFIKYPFLFRVVFNSNTCNNIALNSTISAVVENVKKDSKLSLFDIVITVGVNISNELICTLLTRIQITWN